MGIKILAKKGIKLRGKEIKMYFKEIKINREKIIEHNKHILAVSGGCYGMIDPSILDFAIDSVNNEKDPLKQATIFLYYVGTGHPFENGNKRTAFEVSKNILASGSLYLNASQEEIINFVTGSIAQGKVTKNEIKYWLSSHSEMTEEHPEFNKIITENIEKDKELLKKLD